MREVSAVIPARPPASSAPSTWPCQVRGGQGAELRALPPTPGRGGARSGGGQASPATPLAPLDLPLLCFRCLQLLYGGIIYMS